MNRIVTPGLGQHVMSRACHTQVLFEGPEDYVAFQTLLLQACVRFRLPLLAYCLMPNHWHLVVLPTEELQLARAMQWLITLHAMQLRSKSGTVGKGHIYQGRYRSVLIESDHHLLIAVRYVERNALRAALVARAEDWPWGSLHARTLPGSLAALTLSSRVPLPDLATWIETVNSPHGADEEEAFRQCVRRNNPFGSPEFVLNMAPQSRPETGASLPASRVVTTQQLPRVYAVPVRSFRVLPVRAKPRNLPAT